MKKYIKPNSSVIEFRTVDVVTTSGGIGNTKEELDGSEDF
jgi:hypothetical protein